MKKNSDQVRSPMWSIVPLLLALLLATIGSAVQAEDANSLRARYASLKDRLANNQFQRPLFLESAQGASDLRGDIFSVVEHPFRTVRQALQSVEHWCDILILHLNVKHCKVAPGASRLSLAIGKKYDQKVEDAVTLAFAYRVAAAAPDYLQLQLNADQGPFGTKNYRIQLQAVPVDARRSFIHMSYSYGYGFAARAALQTYLATIGREKVGFSIVGHKPDGRPIYVRNLLGLVERNTMRYYLAIEAYLGAYALPASEQVERRVQTWFASTERYATQLRELQRSEYVEMKRKEIRRQRDQ